MPDRIELTPSKRTHCNRLIRRLCAELQPTKILPGVQPKGSPEAEKRERKKAPSGQLGVRKRPVYNGFFEPNRG